MYTLQSLLNSKFKFIYCSSFPTHNLHHFEVCARLHTQSCNYDSIQGKKKKGVKTLTEMSLVHIGYLATPLNNDTVWEGWKFLSRRNTDVEQQK